VEDHSVKIHRGARLDSSIEGCVELNTLILLL
jgi:hypothetical protein